MCFVKRMRCTCLCPTPHLQALLRGVLPGSFPCALGPEPEVTAGLRRFVVIDENIHRLYGAQIMEVYDLAMP
jgi:hypothetical protein